MEEISNEKPLSPVLNNSVLYRKRKRSSKTRVRLLERFSDSEDVATDFEFKMPQSPTSPAKKLRLSSTDFCTGSGKVIVVSPKAIKQRMDIYKGILETKFAEDNLLVFKKDFSKRVSPVHNPVEIENLQVKVCEQDNTEEDSSGRQCMFHGFSSEECKIPYKLLEKLENVLDEYCNLVESSAINLNFNYSNEFTGLDNTLCKVFASEDLSLIESINNTKDTTRTTVCENSVVKVAVEKGVELPLDVKGSEPTLFIPTCKNSSLQSNCAFSTASGKEMRISDQAWCKSKNMFATDLQELTNIEVTENNFTSGIVSPTMPSGTPDQPLKKSNLFTTDFQDESVGVKYIENSSGDVSNQEPKLRLNSLEKVGFSTASGKDINVTEKAWSKIKDLFGEDLHGKDKPQAEECLKPVGFSTASGKDIEISDQAWRKSKNVFATDFQGENNFENFKTSDFISNQQSKLQHSPVQNVGFSTASGKDINITEKAWSKIKDLFGEDLHGKDKPQAEESLKPIGFSTASGKDIAISDQAWRKSKIVFATDFQRENNAENLKTSDFISNQQSKLQQSPVQNVGFSTASGKDINIAEKAWSKIKDLFCEDLQDKPQTEQEKLERLKPIRFLTEAGKNDEALRKCKLISLQDEFPVANGKDVAVTEASKNYSQEDKSSNLSKQKNGFSTASGKNIKISDAALNKGNRLFADDSFDTVIVENNKENHSDRKRSLIANTPESQPQKSTTIRRRLGMSGCKQINIRNDSLDKAKMFFKELDENINPPPKIPSRASIYSSTPLKRDVVVKQNLKPNILTNLNITPVKRPCVETPDNDAPIVMRRKTDGDVDTWLKNIEDEHENLQKRLSLILKKRSLLQEQQKCLQNQNRRHGLGVLFRKRQQGQRVSLKQLLNGKRPGDAFEGEDNTKKFLWNITPQNAVDVHFNLPWNVECPPGFHTTDGAVVIPNLANLVGLSEIKAAFSAMPGVDTSLIPRRWIDNHFKWIVWKLASYDRNFSELSGSLTMENIIQQLKYRYDRELEKAERPALRRILEKDDVPQKRMVLCVATIFKCETALELELTDGWYSIRTTIDELLKHQIALRKIVVGTKLIVQCSELLNCDGCHPLEVPEYVRLKINFNCTRRAPWYSKLGYQRIAEPFPLSLDSIHFEGGTVGRVKIYIARVYPLRYMEKFEQVKPVWRNAKAEEKRIQEWENEKAREMETIHQKVRNEYEEELKRMQDNTMRYNDLSEIRSSETLYRMMETSRDPDSFRDKLTSSQLESMMDYHHNVHNQRNSEISMRVSKELKKLKNTQRQVHSMLKLLITDCLKGSEHAYVFNIWKPTEEHLEILKEGLHFSVYNILLKSNGDFASTNKTYFKSETNASSIMKWHRRLTSISELQKLMPSPPIKEFDTVGSVVRVAKSESCQEVWVTDCIGNLLLVTVFESSSKCCLFDSISRGQTVAFLNVILCEPKAGFGQGIANQFSVVTCFPQQTFLQDAIIVYDQHVPKDKTVIFEDCDSRIEQLLLMKSQGMGSSISTSKLSFLVDSASVADDFLEDDAMIPSYLTATDVFMSMIDTDQYFENS